MSEQSKEDVIATQSFSFSGRKPNAAPRPASAMTVSFDDDEPLASEMNKPPTEDNQPKTAKRPGFATPPTVAKPLGERSPNHLSVELPSHFGFYDFKTLSVGSVRGKHQAKFAAAAKAESTRLIVEAVSSLLAENISASQLTIPDFQYVLYHLRMNCMGKDMPLKVRGACSNPEHVLKVAEGKLKRDTLLNDDLVMKSQLKETYIDPEFWENFQIDQGSAIEELEALGYTLDAPRMSDSIELEENYLGKPEFDAIEFLTDLAGSIRPIEQPEVPLTLAQRLEIVGDFPPSIIEMLQEWQEVVQSYGVQEFVTIKCKECGAPIEVSASIPAHAFF